MQTRNARASEAPAVVPDNLSADPTTKWTSDSEQSSQAQTSKRNKHAYEFNLKKNHVLPRVMKKLSSSSKETDKDMYQFVPERKMTCGECMDKKLK